MARASKERISCRVPTLRDVNGRSRVESRRKKDEGLEVWKGGEEERLLYLGCVAEVGSETDQPTNLRFEYLKMKKLLD